MSTLSSPPELKNSHSTAVCRNAGGNPASRGRTSPSGRGRTSGRSRGRSRGRGRGRGRGRPGPKDDSSGGDERVDMVHGDEEAVMSVELDAIGAPSRFARTRSPAYMRASSLEEVKCSQCDEAMGPCRTDHTMDETEERICSVALEGEDEMDGGYNTPKLEISHHISCIKINTGSPSLNSYVSTIDISPPSLNSHISNIDISPPSPHLPPHPFPLVLIYI